jgi:hypothetical protein
MTDETERLLFDILQYVRASAVSTIRGPAQSVIDSPRKAKTYAAMSDEKTLQEIVAATGIPRATVWRYQSDFLSAGLAAPPSKYHRNVRSLFTLEELGLAELAAVVEGEAGTKGAEEAAE